MNRRYRKTVIAGNWKMNMTATETKKFAEEIKKILPRAKWCETLICVPACNISTAAKAFKDLRISVGAENVYFEEKGAYTGEVSADMLKDLGVKYVIIGHSERRQYFGETVQTVNARVKAALSKGLKPIICVGETLEEREGGLVESVLVRQTTEAFKDIDKSQLENIVIAYEPVWAIGTGKTATAQDANDTIAIIRNTMANLYCKDCAENKVRIQYGGSMNPKNASELMAMPQIDGGLIGGASLKAVDFSQVVKY